MSMCTTYGDDREQDESSSSGFLGSIRIVYQRVDGRRGEDQTSTQEACQTDMVSVDCIRADHEYDSRYAEQHIDQRPPGVVRVVLINIGDDGADEGNDPARLETRK